MPLILDGYNVLHCSHVLPDKWSQVTAAGLCALIDRAGVSRGRASVVCDGTPSPALIKSLPEPDTAGGQMRYGIGSVDLIYAGGGRDADSLIERMIEDENAPRSLIVVSNDRRVQRAARRRGAQPMASETFLRRLAAALHGPVAPADAKPSAEPDAQGWMRKFGLESDSSDPPDLDGQTRRWLREFGFEEE
jgi:uncharacterized protein